MHDHAKFFALTGIKNTEVNNVVVEMISLNNFMCFEKPIVALYDV